MTELRDLSLTHPNPHTVSEALHWLYEEHHVATHWQNECDHVAALAYGYRHSGEVDAKAHLAEQKHVYHVEHSHPGDLVWWKTGQHDHVAVRAFHVGHVYSIDVKRAGQLSLVTIEAVNDWLDTAAHGASVPYFPHGVR